MRVLFLSKHRDPKRDTSPHVNVLRVARNVDTQATAESITRHDIRLGHLLSYDLTP